MYKYAEEVKQAEVRGCIAAWIDAGQIKVASEGAFEDLCSKVAANLSDDYDLQKVAAVTEAVLSGGMKKTASQETARNAALGELLLMKTAGQIDDSTFVKAAEELMKIGGTSTAEKVQMYRAEGRKVPAELLKQLDYEQMLHAEGRKTQQRVKPSVPENPKPRSYSPSYDKPSMLSRIGDTIARNKKGLAIGGGAALGLGGAAYLGKQLYDKYAQ